MNVKKRETNLELLRIIAMLMVISLHYLDKGNALAEIGDIHVSNPDFANQILAWVLEVCSYGAVNLYIMISGYFLINSVAKMEKPFKIAVQIWFYSAGIFLIFLALGKLPDYATETYYKGVFFTPIASSHYWFASTYVFFYLLAPFVALAIRRCNQKQHLGLMIIMLVLFSRVWRILLPQSEAIDDKGYGLMWFMTLFTVASYIRRFVPVIKKRRALYLIIFFAMNILTLISFFVVYVIYNVTGRFEVFVKVLLEYNSPTIVVSSVCLFLFFRTLRIPDGFFAKAILAVSPLTFGVYLIHEQFLLRDLWTKFWKVDEFVKKPYFAAHFIGTVIAVFAICALIEWVRSLLFGLIYRTKPLRAFFGILGKLDVIFPDKDENFSVAGMEDDRL